jgi:hypothetical protein
MARAHLVEGLGSLVGSLDIGDRVVAPERPRGEHFRPGDAPSQVLERAVQALAKAGTPAIVGVYPPNATTFPIGEAMNKNLTLRMGNCNHRKYLPHLTFSNPCTRSLVDISYFLPSSTHGICQLAFVSARNQQHGKH